MKYLLITTFLFVCFNTYAQVTLKDGKVLVNKTLLCHYLEGDKKENKMKHHASPVFSQVSEDFHDFYFTSPQDNYLAVAIEARVLAHSSLAYITHYYSIKFFSTGEVINIDYRPLRVEAFIKDLAKFEIFKDGAYHSKGIPKLLEKWKTKQGTIDNELVNTGVSKPYVDAGTDAIQDSIVANVIVSKGGIYLRDSLIANYKEGPALDPTFRGSVSHKTYYIQNLSGENIMVLTVPELRSVTFALLVQSNQEFRMISPDKTEAKLIRAATGFLMLMKVI